MEKTTTTKPFHTQGEIGIVERKDRPQSIYIVNLIGVQLFAINFGANEALFSSRQETMEFAKRIVKCVNIHDELINLLKSFELRISGSGLGFTESEINKLKLLKQAEVK